MVRRQNMLVQTPGNIHINLNYIKIYCFHLVHIIIMHLKLFNIFGLKKGRDGQKIINHSQNIHTEFTDYVIIVKRIM